MRTILIGSNGQLGTDLCSTWDDELVALPEEALDVRDRERTFAVFRREAPHLVVNTAAYVRVDDCEDNARLAFDVNALGAKNVADAAHHVGAAVMFISTDYVFDGEKGTPYVEEDTPRPLNVYGASKLAGEHLVRQGNANHYIVRTASLFGVAGAMGKGGNFVETMIRKAREGEPLRVVDDQVSTPTLTRDLAQKLRELAGSGRFGLYHVTNSGQASWFHFAAKIFELAGLSPTLVAITSEELGAPARRPRLSVLENRAASAAGLGPLRSWEEALEAYMREKGHLRPAPRGALDEGSA